MSVTVMSLVWQNGPTKAADRLMLLAIADNSDDYGLAWPGIERLAEKCCVTVNPARATVRRLEDAGWVSTVVGGGGQKGHGQPNRYQINMARLRTPLSTGGSVESTPLPTVQDPPVDSARTPLPTGGEPSVEPSVEPSSGDDALFVAPPTKQRKATAVPSDFRPRSDELALAAGLGVDLTVEGPQFLDHHRAKGSVMKDWDAALRTWIRNAAKFAKDRENVHPIRRGDNDWLRSPTVYDPAVAESLPPPRTDPFAAGNW